MFIKQVKLCTYPLSKQYGINRAEDIRKYFVKVFKGIEQKLLKALYKGCMDTIEEYQNDIKTILFSKKSLWFSHIINKGRMKK